MENVENMEYNTTRNHLEIREYGRHIQKMVEYVLTLEDREKRQKNAYALIELMGFLNPHLKNVEDFRHKLWDHLFLISDFKLDVDSPYPIPTRETLKAKPERLSYPKDIQDIITSVKILRSLLIKRFRKKTVRNARDLPMPLPIT